MSDAVELRFKYAEHEYVSAYRRYFLSKARTSFVILLAIGLVGFGIYLLATASDVALTVSFIATGAFVFGLVITSSVLLPRQRFRNDERFRGEYLVRFSDDVIEFHTKQIDARISWSIYKEAVETKDCYLLSDSGATLTVIPKRAFVSPEQESRFRQLVDANI